MDEGRFRITFQRGEQTPEIKNKTCYLCGMIDASANKTGLCIDCQDRLDYVNSHS